VRRRWDTDERGRGVASAGAYLAHADALRGAMAEPDWVAEDPDQHLLPHVRRFCEALLAKALEGDVAAMNAVMDRVEGKVPQQIQGDPDNPLVIERVMREIIDPSQKTNPLPDARDPRAA